MLSKIAPFLINSEFTQFMPWSSMSIKTFLFFSDKCLKSYGGSGGKLKYRSDCQSLAEALDHSRQSLNCARVYGRNGLIGSYSECIKNQYQPNIWLILTWKELYRYDEPRKCCNESLLIARFEINQLRFGIISQSKLFASIDSPISNNCIFFHKWKTTIDLRLIRFPILIGLQIQSSEGLKVWVKTAEKSESCR